MDWKPTFIDKPPTKLIGFSFFGDPLRLSPGWLAESSLDVYVPVQLK